MFLWFSCRDRERLRLRDAFLWRATERVWSIAIVSRERLIEGTERIVGDWRSLTMILIFDSNQDLRIHLGQTSGVSLDICPRPSTELAVAIGPIISSRIAPSK